MNKPNRRIRREALIHPLGSAAEMLSRSYFDTYRRVLSGEWKGIKIANRWYMRSEEISRIIQAGEEAANLVVTEK